MSRRKSAISARPARKRSRLRQTESGEYAAATRSGSRVFHASSAAWTFAAALAASKGGNGGRVMSPPPGVEASRIILAGLGHHVGRHRGGLTLTRPRENTIKAVTSVSSSSTPTSSDQFGPNEWLVEEMYQRFLL